MFRDFWVKRVNSKRSGSSWLFWYVWQEIWLFRVAVCLSIKTIPGAQPFILKWVLLTSLFSYKSNRPFPSCLLPLFQNESWCTTFHMKRSSICKTISVQVKLIWFPYEVLCTRTRFETEAKNNSVMAIFATRILSFRVFSWSRYHLLNTMFNSSTEITLN